MRPNILIFNPDEWRGDVLGHLGNPGAATPNLDELVLKDGVSFGQTFCQNTVCAPSRCSFMTGWYPHVRGHRTMYHLLQPNEPMLLRTLKQSGYSVWWGGKNDVVPGQLGLEDYCDVKFQPAKSIAPMWGLDPEQSWRGDPDGPWHHSFYRGKIDIPSTAAHYNDGDWAVIEGAVDWLKSRRRNADQPFCMYAPILYPHPPYAVEDPWYSMIDRAKVPKRITTPSRANGKAQMMHSIAEAQNLGRLMDEDWAEIRATYYAMCARVDHQFGLLMDVLKQIGEYDNTAVFVFSDHGDFAGDYGLVEKAQNCMEDALTRVPLVIKPPITVKVVPGVRSALVELIDVPATVEDLTGVPPRHRHFGRSLVPLLEGSGGHHRDAVFCEGGRLPGETEAMELESGRRFEDPSRSLYWARLSAQYGNGTAHGKAVMCRTATHKYVHRLDGRHELYELGPDPGEEWNVAGEPRLAAVRRELEERVLRFFMETADVVPWSPDRRS